MQSSLKEHILRLPHSAWKPYREDREAVSECAEILNYWPEAEDDKQFGPLAVPSQKATGLPEGVRFVAIRIRQRSFNPERTCACTSEMNSVSPPILALPDPTLLASPLRSRFPQLRSPNLPNSSPLTTDYGLTDERGAEIDGGIPQLSVVFCPRSRWPRLRKSAP